MKMNDPNNAGGRILRIKRGYNPNSSSVGSDIPTFLFSTSALVLVTAIATQVHAIITGHFKATRSKKTTDEQTDNGH